MVEMVVVCSLAIFFPPEGKQHHTGTEKYFDPVVLDAHKCCENIMAPFPPVASYGKLANYFVESKDDFSDENFVPPSTE